MTSSRVFNIISHTSLNMKIILYAVKSILGHFGVNSPKKDFLMILSKFSHQSNCVLKNNYQQFILFIPHSIMLLFNEQYWSYLCYLENCFT
ncbi:CLUMA_CG012804, isoform A [Clunio marinus]|uniref:CLUMA_CG012804, isoform A n=1 Tax=Clunio marinus TaxID=568069 RepID=A0A1J1IGV6_9DIPT|nr:CLUMA_CG012804, isoform A [Clunio marinus]